MWGFPKLGVPFWGVSIIRIMVFQGLDLRSSYFDKLPCEPWFLFLYNFTTISMPFRGGLPRVLAVVFFASAFRGSFREVFLVDFRDLASASLPRKGPEDYRPGSRVRRFRLTSFGWLR